MHHGLYEARCTLYAGSKGASRPIRQDSNFFRFQPTTSGLCKLQWLLLVPNPHVFRRLVRNDIQRMHRFHPICLFKDTYVRVVVDAAGDRSVFPGKRRREGFLGSGARVCMVMPMLRRAQSCQRVAGVVRIGMSVSS